MDAIFSDADGVAVARGLAVTGLTGVDHGTWQYSLNGRRWSAVGTVNDGDALLLRPTDRLRFVPGVNYHGQVSLTYRGWDRTAGVAGGRADASSHGGSSAFSDETRTAQLIITPVADVPAATAAYVPGRLRLTPGAAGTTVARLLAGWAADPDGGAACVAVSGLTSTANGNWEISADGITWTVVGSVSSKSVLLLAATDHLRFVPKSGFNGSAEMRFRVWDGTKGTPRSRVTPASAALKGTLSWAELTALVLVNQSPQITTI